jgi:hypothetical protein
MKEKKLVTCDCGTLIEARVLLPNLHFMELNDAQKSPVSNVNMLSSKGRKETYNGR